MDSKPTMFASALAGKTIDFTNTFTIVLEDAGKRYVVYTNPFCTESLFFKRSLEQGFAEAQTREVVVREEQDDETFQHLINWVYGGTSTLQGGSSSPLIKSVDLNGTQLTKLYILADKFLIGNLKNDIVDRFRYLQIGQIQTGRIMDLQALETMPQRGPDSCQLKRLMIEYIASKFYHEARNCSDWWTTKDKAPFQAQLKTMSERHHGLALLVLTTTINVDKRTLHDQSECVYHEHPKGFEKCSRIYGVHHC
ncbi:hypothetical protein LTR05_007543 [Lithohypha guttulata]|uniref:BTB domain-containing protein n=1 Tax=Lithohypha guttulata TaxID=1690604 RepID=A0AAN7SVA3_9EURO|nr:hypothetical protein LTR05_007543 [Lithohypha guttulata]